MLTFLLVAATALAGCGKSEQTGGGKTEEAEKPTTLVYGRGGDSVGLDPATVTDGESFKVTKTFLTHF